MPLLKTLIPKAHKKTLTYVFQQRTKLMTHKPHGRRGLREDNVLKTRPGYLGHAISMRQT